MPCMPRQCRLLSEGDRAPRFSSSRCPMLCCRVSVREPDDQMESVYGRGFVALFSLSAMGGVALRARLGEGHLSGENMDAVRLLTGLLGTFAALVLSLQLSTARTAYNAASRDRATYAAQLANLDQCLRSLGSSQDATRSQLRRYTAAVIASTWRNEPAPTVDGMLDTTHMAERGEDATLARLMADIGAAIDSAAPADAPGANTAARCRAAYASTLESRWAVIEDTHSPSGGPFVTIISLWLALVFLSFGMQIPQRRLTTIVLAIGVFCVASVMFVIVDLDEPYTGIFNIPSVS